MDNLGTTEAGDGEAVTKPAAPPHPNDDAVRLWCIDQALQHLTRQAGVLGFGANRVQQGLRAEREQVIDRLKRYGEEAFTPEEDLPRTRRALSR